jgi:hypothetical protein
VQALGSYLDSWPLLAIFTDMAIPLVFCSRACQT